ncbi:hypothetical protein D7W82_00710 [Corallococcus sp. CA049B]|uniref:hypothetical protein n=1 Tax=Corallococcus sp. CA049B TaxID=2316730 RepID=UPI000EA3B4E2|nr:hypothetical protein [Corallococcus sp. CA049B]RKG91381.1 hypothetical protein D7W82_00710 [Corallococcus sp. CA049B]
MDKPDLPFHDLEFSTEDHFWTGGDATTRRVYLMPVSPPSEFVAFGALVPSEPCFVARGRVEQHLGPFIERMARDDAKVELHEWPPLPDWLVKEYASNPPWEGHEVENPTGTPVRGMVRSSVDTYEPVPGTPLWTPGEAIRRSIFITPVKDASELLALGVLTGTDTVVFSKKGTVQGALGALIAQAVNEGARVELHTWPPLPKDVLHLYLEPVLDTPPR